ncbi:hypothetical protein JX266_000178 [Neoarthrinium moseri]|nr:hypothetical protein JX266_000178 [Neoarthrinium moseri]
MAIPPDAGFWLRFQVHSDGLAPSGAPFHTAFPQFSQLPTELRLQIWALLLQPRILLISCQDPENAAEQESELALRPTCRLVPVLLHVNREARSVGLAHYELAWSWKVPAILADMDLVSSSWDLDVAPVRETPRWSEPRVYFNFQQDAVFLLGELEPCTSTGFNSPMTYFLDREDTKRVRTVAVAFRALRHGESGSQQIFGALFHIVDRIKPPSGRVLVCVNEGDEWTHGLMGGESPLVPGESVAYGTRQRESRLRQGEPEVVHSSLVGRLSLDDEVDRRELSERYQRQARDPPKQEDNVIQKIWRDWYRGSIVTSSLADMQFWLVRESDLGRHVCDDQ